MSQISELKLNEAKSNLDVAATKSKIKKIRVNCCAAVCTIN